MASDSRTTARLQEYEARSANAMVVLAFVFLGFYALQVLWLSAPPIADTVIYVAQCVIWAVFIADFAYRVYLAPRRWSYVARHPLDVATLILPMLRPLRALRIFAAARVLLERGHYVSYGRVAAAIGGAAAFVVLVGALAELDLERYAADSTITTFGESLWWAMVTITTVGYGDISPVTAGGQIAASVMMIVGVSLIGAITASFAAWFTQRVRKGQTDANRELMDELAAIRVELNGLRQQLAGGSGTLPQNN